MKQVAIARMFVEYKLTEIALTRAAHNPQLRKVMNAIIIGVNPVRKFNAKAQTLVVAIQTAKI